MNKAPNRGNKASDGPYVLGINPWIYDFAAYNLWSRPVGLLSCLDLLRQCGTNIALLDCLYQSWSDINWPRPHRYGTGPYPKTAIPKPWPLSNIPRNFSRYGLPYQAVQGALKKLSPPPDLVMVTASMTYWYPGAVAVINLVRNIWPKTLIVLGGVYATLCCEHARSLENVDLLLSGPFENEDNWKGFWNLLGLKPPDLPQPEKRHLALDLYHKPAFSPILGSRGCPFFCTYCASSILYPRFRQRSYRQVSQEIHYELDNGVRDFAFYDDCLLLGTDIWLEPLLQSLKQSKPGVRLHTPNAIHVQYLTPKICRLLRQAGLTTIRLGLESADFSTRLDKKLNLQQWEQGLNYLFEAGFKPDQIGAYILFGLPEQPEEEIKRAIQLAKSWQIRPELAYYSPIPGSGLFDQAVKYSPYPLNEEPLYHNNSLWPCYPGGFSWSERQKWKDIIRT